MLKVFLGVFGALGAMFFLMCATMVGWALYADGQFTGFAKVFTALGLLCATITAVVLTVGFRLQSRRDRQPLQ